MSRRGRRRPANPHPAVQIDIAEVIAQMRHVRRYLRRRGIKGADLRDVEQIVLVGAWQAIEAGRFRPDPAKPIDRTLRWWLIGIASHKVFHYRDRAHRRHERLRGLLFDVHADAWDENARLDAAADLDLFDTVQAKLRLPALMRAHGYKFREIAVHLSIPLGTASSRIIHGRARFRVLMRLRGRR